MEVWLRCTVVYHRVEGTSMGVFTTEGRLAN